MSELNDKEEMLEDFIDQSTPRNYLILAQMDFDMVRNNIKNLKTVAPAVTVSIATSFEKALSHLLMLKAVRFQPTHNSVILLDKVVKEYDDFPTDVNKVVCTLATVWYHTNRYPQSCSKGYENFNLILAMVTVLENLLVYCNEKSKEFDNVYLDFTKYTITKSLSQKEK